MTTETATKPRGETAVTKPKTPRAPRVETQKAGDAE